MKRRIFLGDVQGCREELERLLEKLRFDPSNDELQPVGDLVNRGPDSAGVLRVLRDLRAGGVLGNHDVHLLRAAAGLRRLGPRDTLDSVLDATDREELVAWLALRPWARAWDDVLLIHAAVHPAWKDPVAVLLGIDPLAKDPSTDFATRARYCDASGNRPEDDWPPPSPPYKPWFEHVEEWRKSRVDGGVADRRTIVFGHWARMGLVQREGLRGLDTGCVWGGKLTAWIAEEDRLMQVDAARVYSPVSD